MAELSLSRRESVPIAPTWPALLTESGEPGIVIGGLPYVIARMGASASRRRWDSMLQTCQAERSARRPRRFGSVAWEHAAGHAPRLDRGCLAVDPDDRPGGHRAPRAMTTVAGVKRVHARGMNIHSRSVETVLHVVEMRGPGEPHCRIRAHGI
jgi:hypothetical protein